MTVQMRVGIGNFPSQLRLKRVRQSHVQSVPSAANRGRDAGLRLN